jgi:hypothetical protein
MSEAVKAGFDDWLASQQALLKAFFPAQSGTSVAPPAVGHPLEQQFADMRDTWQASISKWTEVAKEAAKGEMPDPAVLREMFSPASWSGPGSGLMDTALQRVLEGPRYATLWDLDRKLLELQKLRLQRDKEVAAYQAVMQRAWNMAFERFAKTFAAGSEPAAKLTWRGLTDRWLAVANDTLIEVHRSDEFVGAQRRMLRAASDLHLQERKLAEAWSEAVHLPTRTEVDELQRTVTELRREVRLLRRAATAPAIPSSVEPPAPVRKPRAAKKSAQPRSRT